MGEEDCEKARSLASQAKTAANDGDLQGSMELFQQAYALYPSEKIKKRIEKLQEFINSQESEDEGDDMVEIGKKFFLHKSIADNLYQYQKEGVLWFWKLFKRNSGGILGDDMGLGKTIQVIAFLTGMFDAEKIKTVVIVAPLAVLVNWENEFKKWSPGIRLKSFHGSKKQREINLQKIQKSRGVLLTTYGMVLSNAELLCGSNYSNTFMWDYIILDEGHKIKNPNKTSKTIRSIPAKFHYICTGTAIQNNLMEMWSLFDFTHDGQLLGMRKTFDVEFQKPIVRAREKDANAYSQQVGNQISEKLRAIIAPYFLRRTKADLFCNKDKQDVEETVDAKINSTQQQPKEGESAQCTPRLDCVKHDLIIWVYLSQRQLNLYKGIVESQRVKDSLLAKRSCLTELTGLKKICDHPRLQTTLSKLLSNEESQEAHLHCNINIDDDNTANCETVIDEVVHAPPVEELIEDSGKMVFLVRLMEELKKGHHRVLIFSQSRKMLDIIQKVLISFEHKLLRIDGTISNPQDREKIITKFSKDDSYNVLLMTTQIGSVGLNLTTADRLVIFDPSWNPGTDSQAVDRIYRLGQTKNVVIYRLITCGSIEEKIYRKQIFKNAIMKQTTGSSDNPYRYFTNQQLRELFVLDDPKSSLTKMQLEELHTMQSTDEYFNDHLKFLNSDGACVFGVTHHNLLFTQEAMDDKLVGFEGEVDKQVQLATQRVTEETNNLTICTPKKKNGKIEDECVSRSQAVKTSCDASIEEVVVPRSPNVINIDASFQSCNEQKNNSCIEEQDLVATINATFGNINIDDGEEKNSEYISSLDQPEEERKCEVICVENEERIQSPLNSSSHINDNKNVSSSSSTADLYISCIVESDERADMAKINENLAGVNIIDSPEQCNSIHLASDTDDESRSNILPNDGSMCLVNDTDDDDESDADSFMSDCSENRSPVKNEIILDSFNNNSVCQGTDKGNITPLIMRALGKCYRTPPVSPLALTEEERIRRAKSINRDASTPMDSTHMSQVLDTTTVDNSCNESLKAAEDSVCKIEDVSKSRSKSFIDVQDVGCSPISVFPYYENEVSKSSMFKDEVDKCVMEDIKTDDLNPLESGSFIDVQDTGCSPINISSYLGNNLCKKYASSSEEIEDTVPVEHTAIINLYQSSVDTLECSIPNTVPNDVTNKIEDEKSKSPLKPEVSQTDGSEDIGFDFGRLERVRERSIHNRKSSPALHNIDSRKSDLSSSVSELNRIGPCDLELSRTFGHCMLQNRKNSSPIIKKTNNSPAINMKSSDIPIKSNEDKNLSNLHIKSPEVHIESPKDNLVTSSEDNINNNKEVCNTADNPEDVSHAKDFREKKLKHLVGLLKDNMNMPSVDDHILMEISDLIEELNIGGYKQDI